MSKSGTEILLVGAGAVGVYLCGRIAETGKASVSVICRSGHDTIRQHGYDISSFKGDFHFTPAAVYRSAGECPEPVDFVIVALKVLPEIDIPALIRGAVGPETVIVLIQNGIGTEPDVAAAFPDNELISSIAYIGVTRTAPGRIEHLDGGRLKLGVYPGGTSPRTSRLAQLFEQAGIPAKETDEIMRARWEKLVWNVPYNPISVLTLSDTAQIMADPDCLTLVTRIMQEVCEVAAAEGWPLPDDIIERMLDYTRNFRPYKPSMYVDFLHRRPMETEAILGNMVRIAARHGLEVPCTYSVYALLRRLTGEKEC